MSSEDGGDTFLPKRRFLQEAHGITSQKTAIFIVTAAKTSNLTKQFQFPKRCVFR
jgi:hypothetical protein